MKRITFSSLACLTFLTVMVAAGSPRQAIAATPNPNSAVVKTRIFNDCPFTTINVVNNYPALLSIEDAGLACSGFANLHNWSFSVDGVNSAPFNNDADFQVSADLVLDGSGTGEAGLRISPWWSQDVDGRFNVRVPDGEIACFGGRLPFYTFTGVYGLHYMKGEPIHLAITYKPHGLNSGNPATIEYELTYQGTTYKSGALNFDMGTAAEDPPHGLWGMLNDGRVGGYVQPRMDDGNFSSTVKATFTNIRLVICPVEPDPTAAVITPRVFNDCPFATLTTVNNYPSQISFTEAGLACSGFANFDVWTVSDDGVNGKVLNNDHDFRLACDMTITGRGEGGLRVSPWWSHEADGLFNARTTDGEIACFGGRLPFYSFTGAHGLHYAAGNPIHLEAIYRHHGLSSASPATIEYKLTYLGNSYSSGALNFDEANTSEDPPHGLWGMLNDARAGGHMKAFMTAGDFSATTVGTFTNIEFESGVDMAVEVKPNKLKIGDDKDVTAYLEPPAPYAAADIDVASLRFNGAVGAISGSAVIGDHDGDGVPDLKVKFPGLQAIESVGSDLKATVTGMVGNTCFAGSDTYKKVKVMKPAAGSFVASGGSTLVQWATPAGMNVVSVAVYYSLDNGDSWKTVAEGLANTGSYTWSVPNVTASTARVAVLLDDGTPDNVTGISGMFTINGTVGVGDPGEVGFALKGTFPNPSGERMTVSLSLPDNKRAVLSLYDVGGRRLAWRDVGSLGAGHHTVTLAQRLPAGVYMLRLDREGASIKTRATVVR